MCALRGSKARTKRESKDKCTKSSQRSCKRQQPAPRKAQRKPVKSNGDDKWESINGQFENPNGEFPFAEFSGIKRQATRADSILDHFLLFF